MKRDLRIAIAQINPTVGDLTGNRDKIIGYIKKAKKAEADIVIFPELATCGYPPEDLLLKGHFIKDNLRILQSIAKSSKGITSIVGFVDQDKNGDIYNAAAIIDDAKLKGIYRKMRLPNYGVFDEKRYFSPGQKNYIYKKGDINLGISICEDIWDSKGPHHTQALSGANILINISASPYHAGKGRIREKMLCGQAQKNGCFVCYANIVGGQDELVFDGDSLIANPKGRIIASGKQFIEDLVMSDIVVGAASKPKEISLSDRNIELVVISRRIKKAKKKPLKKHISKRQETIEEMYNALVVGTRDYVKKNDFEKIVIGLSGGIDSALVAAIACDAIGKRNVIAVAMPSRYSSKGTQRDAKALARNLGIKLITVSIDSVFDSYLLTLSKQFKGKRPDVTEENIQARVRGNILMALSNKFGWLVFTTGNKSEASVGYCTLYGDMAGGFGVIKDLPKTSVYKLAKFINKKERRCLIPKSIITRAPSAELKLNQKDQDTLPSYSILDSILKDYVEEDKGYEDIIRKGQKPSVVKKVIKMVDKNEYKRRQASPGIRITPKAFGRDRRLPITNKYRQY